ncbi:MAG: hypothetical protein LUF33_06005 [Clostridiales bacterium]|nr:hypothetical protein [Clostridiales bacterium]
MNKDILKKESVSGIVRSEGAGEISDEEMELINGYTRRTLEKDEVYVFSVILCDNDVDRDGERFTTEALFELEKLFVGKTGIFDHEPSAKNQTARIFACGVEAVPGQTTAAGDDYYRLRARAYMPISDKTEELMLALDSGIVKEVSVGCAVDGVRCSVCGEGIGECAHRKGEVYGGKLCCGELVNPRDAYEWSFVAVPAQTRAGVTKSFAKEGKEMKTEEILKGIEQGEGVALGKKDCERLCEYISNLKESAKDGVYYRESLVGEVLRLSAVVQPDISRDTMESAARSMTVAQLNEFKTAFEKKRSRVIPVAPQLYNSKAKDRNRTDLNGQFTI